MAEGMIRRSTQLEKVKLRRWRDCPGDPTLIEVQICRGDYGEKICQELEPLPTKRQRPRYRVGVSVLLRCNPGADWLHMAIGDWIRVPASWAPDRQREDSGANPRPV